MQFSEKDNVSSCGPDTERHIEQARQLRSEALQTLFKEMKAWIKAKMTQKDAGPIAALEKFHRSALEKAC